MSGRERDLGYMYKRNAPARSAPPSLPSFPSSLFTKNVPLNTIARKNHINNFVQKQHARFSFILLLNENMK